mgnify:CR=1 FL=1
METKGDKVRKSKTRWAARKADKQRQRELKIEKRNKNRNRRK